MSQSRPKPIKHTELSILESYLLPPSPLPTILPYQTFLQLIPAQHRAHPHLKRFYRDLQFQRAVDVDTVRQNIEREVHQSTSLKAALARRIASENGVADNDADASDVRGQQRGRRGKRKRDSSTTYENDEDVNDGDEFTDPRNKAIDTTYYEASLHPSHDPKSSSNHPLTAGVLAPSKRHHTRTSVLQAMETACSHLESEISDLESESARLLGEMDEIVGGLSDLRYGRFTKSIGRSGKAESGGEGGGIEGGGDGTNEGKDSTVEDDVLDALRALQRAVKGRME